MNKINLYINILKWFMFFMKRIFKVWFLNLFLLCIDNVLIWFICLDIIVVMKVNCFVISICKSVWIDCDILRFLMLILMKNLRMMVLVYVGIKSILIVLVFEKF